MINEAIKCVVQIVKSAIAPAVPELIKKQDHTLVQNRDGGAAKHVEPRLIIFR